MTSSSGERHCPPGCFVCLGLAAVAPQSAVAIVWARTQKFPCNCAPCRRNLRIGRVRSLRSSSSRRTWGIPRPELAYCYRNRNVCRDAQRTRSTARRPYFPEVCRKDNWRLLPPPPSHQYLTTPSPLLPCSLPFSLTSSLLLARCPAMESELSEDFLCFSWAFLCFSAFIGVCAFLLFCFSAAASLIVCFAFLFLSFCLQLFPALVTLVFFAFFIFYFCAFAFLCFCFPLLFCFYAFLLFRFSCFSASLIVCLAFYF